jgi:hypothetical protein
MQILIKKPTPDSTAAKMGDVIAIDGQPCILAQVNAGMFDFIRLEDGNRYFGPQHSIDALLKLARQRYFVERLEKIVTE